MPVETEVLELEQGKVLCLTPVGVDTFREDMSLPKVAEKSMTPEIHGIMVDFGRLELIDSIGLGKITGLAIKFRKKVPIVLVNMDAIVANVFRVSNMHKVFDVCPTRQEGLDHLQQAMKKAKEV